MSNFTVEQKSLLTKLMATENITVQHQKINTAKFDVKNRILYLPIWADMESFMYDHLGGHEVGHALYTPAEGWHDAATDNTKGRGYKSFLNIVEDARIEKKVKRKYPGLRQSFIKSFAELMRRDFFGIGYRDINTLPFIDRANIYSKSQYTYDIEFSDREWEFIDRLQNTETWEDVVALTNDLYEYAKHEEPQTESGQDFHSGNEYDDENFDGYEETESDEEFDEDSKDSMTDQSDEVESEEFDDSKSEETEDGSDDEEESGDEESGDEESGETDNKINREKETEDSVGDPDPTCETDDNYRRNESSLIDECARDYVYVNFPQPILSQIVTPAKRVQELLSTAYEQFYTAEQMQNELSEFKRKNERYVSLLAKEFEMKKAAKAYAKRRVSDTGDIDINKLASYKFNDNIFRRLTKISKGKSHGLVLLLDYSGSMSDNMAASIEQILVLTMFCRKVNIPFTVYTFGNSSKTALLDRPEYPVMSSWTRETDQVKFSNVHLREYINSRMSNAEYTKALRNMVLLRKSYFSRYGFRPPSENLSNTPTLEAIVALQPIVKEFSRFNNLDLTNLVIVQDGDADQVSQYYGLDNFHGERYGENYKVLRGMVRGDANVYIQDTSEKFSRKLSGNNYHSFSESMFSAVVDWFSKTTNSKVFGFFLVPQRGGALRRAIMDQYYDANNLNLRQTNNHQYEAAANRAKELAKELRRDKVLVSHKPGYKEFYMIPGGQELMTENDQLTVEGKFTTNKLKTAFMKMNEKKQLNRILVSKFIDGIAA